MQKRPYTRPNLSPRLSKDWRCQFGTSNAEATDAATLRSQFVTSKTETRGGTQYAPMAFTEHGVRDTLNHNSDISRRRLIAFHVGQSF